MRTKASFHMGFSRRLFIPGILWMCLFAPVYAFSAPALAPSDCSVRASITSLRHVLYKPENIHGGRGPTFIVQNPFERTGKRSIQIRDVLCRKIGSFGLFATDWPYGARYYTKVAGGSRADARTLYKLARKAGSSKILVQGVGKWIVIKSPLLREGVVMSG